METQTHTHAHTYTCCFHSGYKRFRPKSMWLCWSSAGSLMAECLWLWRPHRVGAWWEYWHYPVKDGQCFCLWWLTRLAWLIAMKSHKSMVWCTSGKVRWCLPHFAMVPLFIFAVLLFSFFDVTDVASLSPYLSSPFISGLSQCLLVVFGVAAPEVPHLGHSPSFFDLLLTGYHEMVAHTSSLLGRRCSAIFMMWLRQQICLWVSMVEILCRWAVLLIEMSLSIQPTRTHQKWSEDITSHNTAEHKSMVLGALLFPNYTGEWRELQSQRFRA